MNESLWQLERLKREWEIQSSQMRYWGGQLLGVWLLSIFLLLLFALVDTADRLRYVGKWLQCAIWPFQRVVLHGVKYDKHVLAQSLNTEVYGGSPLEWLWWAGEWGLLPAILCTVGGWLWIKRQREHGEQHVRGAEVMSSRELQTRLASSGQGGITVAGIQLPKDMECEHLIVVGATGSGKSMQMRDLLMQFEANGEPAVVVDPAFEYAPQFYKPERGDWLINPLYTECPTWTPWIDGDSEAEIRAQAASLIPVVPGMVGAEKYYREFAQRIYRRLLQQARVHEVSHIPDLLQQQVEAKGGKIAPNEVLSTLQNALESFRYLRPGPREWSPRRWVENPDGWVFLSFQKKEAAAVLPFLSFQLECITRELMSGTINPDYTVRLVIDELAALGVQPTLAQVMSEIRKRGVSVALGFQDINQLYALYGKYFTHNILNQPSTALLLRTNDPETQRWCADRIGQREVVRPVETESVGPISVSDRVSRSHQRRTEDAVMPTEFQLDDFHGFQKVKHFGTARVRTPFRPLIPHHPDFVPHTDGTLVPKPPAVVTLNPRVRSL